MIRDFWLLDDVQGFSSAVDEQLLPPYPGRSPSDYYVTLYQMAHSAVENGDPLPDESPVTSALLRAVEEHARLHSFFTVTLDVDSAMPDIEPLMDPSVVTPLGRRAILISRDADVELPPEVAEELAIMPSYESLLAGILMIDYPNAVVMPSL